MRLLDGPLQAGQGLRPELSQQPAHGLQRLLAERVEPSGAVAAFREQAGRLEDADVLADRLLSEREARRDLSGRQLPVLDQAQDLSAMWVCQSAEHRVRCLVLRPRSSDHGTSVSGTVGVS